MLSGPVAFQRLQPVSGRNPQILQDARIVEHTQFAQGGGLNVGWKFPAMSARPDAFCLVIGETLDHEVI